MKTLLSLLPLGILIACNSSSTQVSSGNNQNVTVFGEDPLATYAWHLQNTGQSSFSASSGTSGEDLKVYLVHNSGIRGNGIKIAISDSGVETTHPDLTNTQLSSSHRSYALSPSAWRNADPYPIEHEGHGTAVAGLASAQGWNSIGSRGVAPSARYGAFLFIGNFYTSDSSYQAAILDQLTGSFDIFNYSYGYVGCEFIATDDALISGYKAGVTNLRGGKGAIYVKAAGNDYIGYNSDCDSSDSSYFFGNTNTGEDQNLPYLILAAATNAKGKISSYSTPGSGLWVASAGGEFGTSSPAMVTTDIQGCSYGISDSSSTANAFDKGNHPLNKDCSYTSAMNGTSSATPVLSAVVALMLEANPQLTWRDVKHILAVTADKINYSTAPITHPGGASYALSGYTYDYLYVKNAAGIDFSNTYGFGRVNAQAAVTMAKTYTSALGTFVETDWNTNSSGTIALAIPDNSATGVSSPLTVASNTIVESVQIKISVTHPFLGDLGVELKSPSGTVSRLLHVNSNIKQSGLSDYTLLSNAFYGESSAGTWTLKVIDGANSHTGTLTNWKLKINGHAP